MENNYRVGGIIGGTLFVLLILSVFLNLFWTPLYISERTEGVTVAVESKIPNVTATYSESWNMISNEMLILYQLREKTVPHNLLITVPKQMVEDIHSVLHVTFTCEYCNGTEISELQIPQEGEKLATLTCKCKKARHRQILDVTIRVGEDIHAVYVGPASNYRTPKSIQDFDYSHLVWRDFEQGENRRMTHKESGMQFSIDAYEFGDLVSYEEHRVGIVLDENAAETAADEIYFSVTGGVIRGFTYGYGDKANQEIFVGDEVEIPIRPKWFYKNYTDTYTSPEIVYLWLEDAQGKNYILPLCIDKHILAMVNEGKVK